MLTSHLLQLKEGELTTVPELGTFAPIMGTLLTSLFPSTRIALLECFFLHPDKRYYLREIIKKVDKGQGSVQREIGNLVSAGIVAAEKTDSKTYYVVNTRCLIYSELTAIINKTVGIIPILSRALAEIDGIEYAFVFGSIAIDEGRQDSDVDLAIIGHVSFRDVVRAISSDEFTIGREINPVVYSPEDFTRRYQAEEHFISELVRTDKQFLIGNQNDFTAMVG